MQESEPCIGQGEGLDQAGRTDQAMACADDRARACDVCKCSIRLFHFIEFVPFDAHNGRGCGVARDSLKFGLSILYDHMEALY